MVSINKVNMAPTAKMGFGQKATTLNELEKIAEKSVKGEEVSDQERKAVAEQAKLTEDLLKAMSQTALLNQMLIVKNRVEQMKTKQGGQEGQPQVPMLNSQKIS